MKSTFGEASVSETHPVATRGLEDRQLSASVDDRLKPKKMSGIRARQVFRESGRDKVPCRSDPRQTTSNTSLTAVVSAPVSAIAVYRHDV